MLRKSNSRDLGLRGGAAGKGDAPRYKHDANWTSRFAEINFAALPNTDDGFRESPNRPGRKVKHYGVRKAEPLEDACFSFPAILGGGRSKS